jgi:hypothetical protein
MTDSKKLIDQKLLSMGFLHLSGFYEEKSLRIHEEKIVSLADFYFYFA